MKRAYIRFYTQLYTQIYMCVLHSAAQKAGDMMAYAIFSVKKEDIDKVDEILKDDVVSRQSIVVRNADALNIKKDVQFILIEGDQKAIKKAEELFKGIGKKEKSKKIYEKFKEEEKDVAEGVGFIFG